MYQIFSHTFSFLGSELKEDLVDQENSEKRKSSNSGTGAYLANVSTDWNANTIPVNFNNKSPLLGDYADNLPLHLDSNKNFSLPVNSHNNSATQVHSNNKTIPEASIKKTSISKRSKR